MQQIVPSFEGAQVIFASTGVLGASTASGEGFHAGDVRLTDYNQNEMRKAFRGLVEAVRMICSKVKLSIVISTGAAPGPLMCLLVGRNYGAKTIWLDSIANYLRSLPGLRDAYKVSTRVGQNEGQNHPINKNQEKQGAREKLLCRYSFVGDDANLKSH